MKLPFKLISRSEYNTHTTKAEMYANMYNQSEETWSQKYQELEFKLEEINYMINELLCSINTKMSKDAIKKKVRSIKIFIEKGKRV